MKKRRLAVRSVALLLCATVIGACSASAAGTGQIDTGVHLRDPFVLEKDGTYYMYGTGLKWNGYGCVYSADLENWSDPVRVFTPPEGFDGDGDWWAPECWEWNGSFYLFATYHSRVTGKRGVAIFRSDDPLGPFENITDGHITPADHDAIDGTLYVDGDGRPWMVYVGEWTDNEDGAGDMMAARMNDDLTCFVSEPILLFRGNEPRWASGRITDGPFLYRTETGRLLMLWSNTNSDGYCVGVAWSSNGRIDGKWRQQPWELYKEDETHADGGHGMIFTAPDGTMMLSVHSPNYATEDQNEKGVFIPVDDIGDTLVLSEKNTFFTRTLYKLYYALMRFVTVFDGLF
ncbi:MAG: glycoside hydrolase family 43 protein [Clostridia bacterium]|nr:glycoside hydrolase family 43 protein [Clostridia bacterium]